MRKRYPVPTRQTVLIVEASRERANLYYANIARAHQKPGPHRIDADTPEVGLSLLSSNLGQPDIIVFVGQAMTFGDGKRALEEAVAKNAAARAQALKKK
jgi:hypothetical protein